MGEVTSEMPEGEANPAMRGLSESNRFGVGQVDLVVIVDTDTDLGG